MSAKRILVVDDEEHVRDVACRALKRQGFEVEIADRASTALEAVERFHPDLVLTDIMMPDTDGIELTRKIRKGHPDMAIVIMTGYGSVDTAIESLKLGVDDYIRKPFAWEQAVASIQAALDKQATTRNNRKYVEDLERNLQKTQRKTGASLLSTVKALFSAEGDSRKGMLDTVESLALAMGARDPVTQDHSRKVAARVTDIAKSMSFPPQEVNHFRLAGILHDVGKVGVGDEILRKNTADMTPEEFERYMEHPVISHKILQPVKEFQPILAAVLHHHESFDGKGFPAKLSGASIPIGARIIAVADAYCHVSAEGAHDEFVHETFVVEYLMAERGTRFDPEIVDTFIKVLRKPQS